MCAKSKLEVRIRSDCSEARVYSKLCLNKFCPAYDKQVIALAPRKIKV